MSYKLENNLKIHGHTKKNVNCLMLAKQEMQTQEHILKIQMSLCFKKLAKHEESEKMGIYQISGLLFKRCSQKQATDIIHGQKDPQNAK